MFVRSIYIVAFVWASMVLTVLAAGNVPDSRGFYALQAYGVELIIAGVSQLKSPDETRVLAGEYGAYLNTNQEFIYVATGRDFKNFTSKALNKEMILYTDTPKLPVDPSTRRLAADDQNLTVTVTHRGDYSSLAIVLDRRYNRTPRWIPAAWGGSANPGAYPGYPSEQPFCGRTLDAVLKELTGNGAAYRPQYYVVNYEGWAEVVVPLQFRRISGGRVLKHSGFDKIHLIMFGPSTKESLLGLDPDTETDATVGAFGMRLASARELMYGRLFFAMLENEGRKNPMYITLDTPQKLPTSSGVQSFTADGQKVSVGVWHSKDSSRVVIALPQTYQRTPHWWPVIWGGLYNPGNYPDWAREKPFCERTLKAVLEKLVSGSVVSYRPKWYTVSYASEVPELGSLDPALDISLQGEATCTLIVPLNSGAKTGAAK